MHNTHIYTPTAIIPNSKHPPPKHTYPGLRLYPYKTHSNTIPNSQPNILPLRAQLTVYIEDTVLAMLVHHLTGANEQMLHHRISQVLIKRIDIKNQHDQLGASDAPGLRCIGFGQFPGLSDKVPSAGPDVVDEGVDGGGVGPGVGGEGAR
jgi:hypothetical protein